MLLDWFIYWVIFVAYLIEDRGKKRKREQKQTFCFDNSSETFQNDPFILKYQFKRTKNDKIDDFLTDGFV